MKISTKAYFQKEVTERALALQAQSYEYLQWLSALEKAKIRSGVCHQSPQLSDASHAWIVKNYETIPSSFRPSPDNLVAFSNLFVTYLESSFDFIESPGQRLYSEDAHCFYFCCSWLIDIPNLQPKKVTPFDKRRAKKLQAEFVHALASAMDVESDACKSVLADESLREDIALGTWMAQLLERLKGISPGPAVLALWRSFAWTRSGSPKKNFRVTPGLIEESLHRLQEALRALA